MRSMGTEQQCLFQLGQSWQTPWLQTVCTWAVSLFSFKFQVLGDCWFGPCLGPCPCKDQVGSSAQRMQQASLDMGRVVSLSSSGAVVSWSQPFAAPAGEAGEGRGGEDGGCWLLARQLQHLGVGRKTQKNELLQQSLAGRLNKEQTAGHSRLELSACQQPGAPGKAGCDPHT